MPPKRPFFWQSWPSWQSWTVWQKWLLWKLWPFPAIGVNDQAKDQGAIDAGDWSLNRLCKPPENWWEGDSPPIDAWRFNEIAIHLETSDKYSTYGSRLPRIYTILRNMGRLDLLDRFASHRITDLKLPFNEQTLPRFVDHALHEEFLLHQRYVLTEPYPLEDGGPHMVLDESEDVYFHHVRDLGQGGYGDVDLVMSVPSLRYYVRKRVARGADPEMNRTKEQYIIDQLAALKALSHRHLVQYIGSYTYIEHIAFLMSPVADMDLENYLLSLAENRQSKMTSLRSFFGCLAGAMEYLHKQEIGPRGVKPSNILVKDDRVFISDFGTGYRTGTRSTTTNSHVVPLDFFYIAPEVTGSESGNMASDMWSLGIVFLEILIVLFGNTLQEFKHHLHLSAGRSQREPYMWNNMDPVFAWLRKLNSYKISMKKDNVPLTWTRALLNPRPEERLDADRLIRQMRESPVFSAFCCLDCQLQYTNRSYIQERMLSLNGTWTGSNDQVPAPFDENIPRNPDPKPLEGWVTLESLFTTVGELHDETDNNGYLPGSDEESAWAATSTDCSYLPLAKEPTKEDVSKSKRLATEQPARTPKVRAPKQTFNRIEAAVENPARQKQERDAGTTRSRSQTTGNLSPKVHIGNIWHSASTKATQNNRKRNGPLGFTRYIDGYTNPELERACREGNAQKVRCLLKKGCNPGTRKKQRRGPLINAVLGGTSQHYKCVQALLEWGVDLNVKHPKSRKTPLHLAIETADFEGHTNLVRDLVAGRANPNIPDAQGERPIHAIFKGGRPNELEKFRLDELECILTADFHGDTEINVPRQHDLNFPLHLAVQKTSPLAVEMLLDKGADVNAVNSVGATPLLLAAMQWAGPLTSDQSAMLEILLNAPSIDLDKTSKPTEQTALHWGVVHCSPSAVRLLVKRGADASILDAEGKTAVELGEPDDPERENEGWREIRALLDPQGQHAAEPKENEVGADEEQFSSRCRR